MQERHKICDDDLLDAYSKEPHLGKLAVKFKVSHIQIWRKCKILGLAFKMGGKNEKIPLQEILEGFHPYYQTLKLKKRLIKENIFENKCLNCSITTWNDKEIILHLDHINGDSSDHRISNLRLLCPNCHSQTDTWCGRNKRS